MFKILPKQIKRVYVGFNFPSFLNIDHALNWIKSQDGYKNKTVKYIVICDKNVEID